MDSKGRWKKGLFSSLFFHAAMFFFIAFAVASGALTPTTPPGVVEIDVVAEVGGGGGGGGGPRPNVTEVDASRLETMSSRPDNVQQADREQNLSDPDAIADKNTDKERPKSGPVKVPHGTDMDGPNSGTGGGYGAGSGDGIGRGQGPGTGSGSGGGHGSGQGGGVGSGKGGVKVPPRPLNEPRLNYPEEARRNNISGTAIVRVVVNADGSIGGVSITKSSGSAILDQEALNYAQKIRFSAARDMLGQPMACATKQTVDFNLK